MAESLDTRAKAVFEVAIELRGGERADHVRLACGDDAELRTRVEELLEAAEKRDVFLSEPTVGLDRAASVLSASEAPGTRIGAYKLLERIGEGGFGTVFMAEQSAPVRRRVALKIIKLGMDTRAVVVRFEQERQALAVMDHPNIAKVFDAGATDSGRPYFVMELVKGEPITAYADSNHLSIPERLELFTQVCRAVQHAHTKGVIHRDIKPTNVLVSTQDGRPFCKVIDFGIAKATLRPLIDETVFTEFRQLVGTPEYMSPEQAAGSLDIDTRTDVYSLGVLLYELLTGVTPFDPQQLRSAAFDEMRRIIREVDPPTPSTRLTRSRALLGSIAAQRAIEPRKLEATIRGELDWIVMRALDKDRGRRYGSAGSLSDDLGRYLAGDPVEAAPPGVAYRMRKVVRRHRVGVFSGALVVVALLAGLSAALWQGRIASRERDAARASAAEAVAAKNESETRRRELAQVAEFQASQLRGIDVEAMGRRLRDDLLADAKSGMDRKQLSAAEVAARQDQLAKLLADANLTEVSLKALDQNIFERALRAVAEQFKEQPVIKARLLQTLSETMKDLGLLEHATAPQSEALEIRRKILGDEHGDTLNSTLETGTLLMAQGKLKEAEGYFRTAVAVMPRVFGPDSREAIGANDDLATVLQLEGKLAEAEPLYRASLEKSRRLRGTDDSDTLTLLNNLGFLLFAQGKLADAESCFREALERLRRIKGDDHPNTLASMNNLASIIQRRGKLADAEPYFREALERSRRTRGDDHSGTLQFANNLGFVLYLEGKLVEAEPYTRDTLIARRRVLGNDHWDTLQSINNLGMLLQAQGKLAESEPYLREAIERRRRVLGENHQATLQSTCNLGILLRHQGKLKEAEPLLRAAMDGRRRTLGSEHPDTLESMKSMGMLEAAEGKLDAAERDLREALAGDVKCYGEKHVETARTRCELGVVVRDEHRFPDAEALLLMSEGALREGEKSDEAAHERCREALVKLYEMWETEEPAHGYAKKASDWGRR